MLHNRKSDSAAVYFCSLYDLGGVCYKKIFQKELRFFIGKERGERGERERERKRREREEKERERERERKRRERE